MPKFLYFVALDIPKQYQYHREKKILFASSTLRHTLIPSNYCIGQPMHEYLDHSNVTERYSAWGIKPRKGHKE